MRPVLYLLCSSKRKPKLISINLTQMCPCIKMCSCCPWGLLASAETWSAGPFFHMNKRPLTSSPCQRSSHNTDYVDHHQINICVFSNDWFSRAEGRSKSSDWVSFIMSYSNWNDVREYGWQRSCNYSYCRRRETEVPPYRFNVNDALGMFTDIVRNNKHKIVIYALWMSKIQA